MSRKLTVGSLMGFFLDQCAAYNRSPSTIRAYRDTLEQLSRLIPDIRDSEVAALNKQMVIAFTTLLSKNMNTSATVNHHLRNLRAFIYWCAENDYIIPFKVKLIKENAALKTPYQQAELNVLLRKPHVQAPFTEWRNWAIVNLVLGVALRTSTIINIRMEDIDIKESTLMTRHNKNGRVNVLLIPPTLKQVLIEYMRHRPESNYLFCAQSGEPLLPTGLAHAISKYNKSRGVTKTSVHLLRHTFGKLWAESGGDVFGLQQIFDHSDIRMTQRYVNLYAGDKDKARTLAFNPLENLRKDKR